MGDNPHPRASYQVSLLPPKIFLNQIMSFPTVNLAVAPILLRVQAQVFTGTHKALDHLYRYPSAPRLPLPPKIAPPTTLLPSPSPSSSLAFHRHIRHFTYLLHFSLSLVENRHHKDTGVSLMSSGLRTLLGMQ